jgi:hypothetical protein
MGRTFVPPPGGLGGDELHVSGFAIGHAPLVRLSPASTADGERDRAESRFVPVYTDGDCAALHLFVTGVRVPRFEGELSAGYREAVRPRPAADDAGR